MNIIAKAKDGFVLVATDDEIARIAGFRSAYSMSKKPEVGQSVDVNGLFDALIFERSRPDALSDTAMRLRTEADRIDKINATLHCAISTPDKQP